MPRIAEYWCALSPRARLACWLMLSTGLVALCWQAGVRPAWQAQATAYRQLTSLRETSQAQRQRALTLRLPEEASAQLADTPGRFSPLDFQFDDARLVRWRPEGQGGELVLQAQWRQVPETFVRLALSDVTLEAFTVVPRGVALEFTLRLINGDDD